MLDLSKSFLDRRWLNVAPVFWVSQRLQDEVELDAFVTVVSGNGFDFRIGVSVFRTGKASANQHGVLCLEDTIGGNQFAIKIV